MQSDFHKTFHKSKKITFIELLMLTRRYYLIFFFNIKIDEFIKVVFLNIKMFHSQYKKIITKMR